MKMMGPEIVVRLPSTNLHNAVFGLMLMLRPGLACTITAWPCLVAGSPESV
jgi:hypothetical protein